MIKLTDHELEKAIDREKKKCSARRLAEVQEQSKALSKKILDSRRNYKKTLLDCIVKELVVECEERRKVEEKEICRKIKASFEEIGSAHKAAESEPDYKEIKDKRLESFHKVTKVRGKIAAKISEDIKRKIEEEREYPRRLKREVRSLEDLRAAYLVSEFKETEPRKRESSRDRKKKPEGVLVFDRKNLHQYVSNRPRNFVSKSSPRPNAIEKAKECCEDEEKRLIEKEENKKVAEERGKRALKSQAVKRQYLKMIEALSTVELESDWDITPVGPQSRSIDKISNSSAIDLHTALEATKGTEQMQELSIMDNPDVVDKRIIQTDTTVKDDILCTTPEFSQPLMVDVPCPKKLCDSGYLKNAQNVLEQLKQKRKELEKEFENIPLVAMSSHSSNYYDITNEDEEEEEEMNLSECRDLAEKIKNLKKDLLSHNAFDSVLESGQKSKNSMTLESPSSNLTTSTSYLDLPLTLTRRKDKQSSVCSFTSTQYKSLPENVAMAFPRRYK